MTINYRVGPFGFLTLNLPDYSGNMALKDQAVALQWIYENIENFGGDKKRITVFGHSSGTIQKANFLNWMKIKHFIIVSTF